MSLTTTINYDTPGNFTYNASLIDITTGATLVDLRPTDATCYASYDSTIDLTWGDGVLTGTSTGGAAVSGGKLDLTGGGVKYVSYDADLSADSQQVGCIRFKLTPNYSTTPGAYMGFVTIAQSGSSDNNTVGLITSNTGVLFLQIIDSTASFICNANLGTWTCVSGTEYEFEINWDVTTGANRVFIDGVQFGSTNTGTGARSSNISLLRVGNYRNPTQPSNFKVDDLMIFSTVQHTANYTPASYGTTQYSTANPTILLNSSTSMDGLDAFSEVATKAGSDEVKYTIVLGSQDKYWDGAAWSNSAGTYAQANTAAEIETNKASLDLSAGYNVKTKAFLHSNDGSTAPTLTSNTLDYDFYIAPPGNINECIVHIHLSDLLQDQTDFTSLSAKFYCKTDQAFTHSGKVFGPFDYEVDFSAAGYAEFSVIETTTIEKYLEFRIEYVDDNNFKKVINFTPVYVPDQPTAGLLTITSPT